MKYIVVLKSTVTGTFRVEADSAGEAERMCKKLHDQTGFLVSPIKAEASDPELVKHERIFCNNHSNYNPNIQVSR